MLELGINEKALTGITSFCRRKGITLPTFAMMRDPKLVPESILHVLAKIRVNDVHPANLYRITWKNQPRDRGGLFGEVNHLILPPELTGCMANILVLVGRYLPTGAHKVGAALGCLLPRLVTGQFNPATMKAVWPSTGNFCRGGAYLSAILGCQSIAILPKGISRERLQWLRKLVRQVIMTRGSDLNVKEIFDKCSELQSSRRDLMVFNQFEDLGNSLWHYAVTGSAAEETYRSHARPGDRVTGFVSASGSAGTLGAGYYLKGRFPGMKLAVAEPLQCSLLMLNGFGGHQIKGIGDKHVPWIHDCRSTDMVIAVDDEACIRLSRLFNEDRGRKLLEREGVPKSLVSRLEALGLSGIANLVSAVKFAKYFELTTSDWVVTVASDSMDHYRSRLSTLNQERGEYRRRDAERDRELLANTAINHMKELTYYDRKSLHNLKYFTWVDQQGRSFGEFWAQWSDPTYWEETFAQTERIDELICEFNRRVGLNS